MPEPAKVAYVFPGQGAQSVGMGRDFYDSFASAKAIFAQADEVLGFPLSRLCFEGPEEELRLTINAQPALVTVSYACLKIVQELSDGGLPLPTFVAGHSLGEYTALAAANVLDFATTVRLARERGRLMYEAGLENPGGMTAIIGLDEALLVEVCKETDTCIANYNSPVQMVISGAMEHLPRAAELALEKGASRVVPLQVSGAFHSPFMKPAQESLSAIIATLNFNDPAFPIIGNVKAQPMTTADAIKTELTEQLLNGVQWQRSVEYMIDNGVSTFIEIGPGRVLSGLIRRINKEVSTQNIGDAEAIKNIKAA
ncbi:ACP S-malonyltransferase [Chloroflexota bacterium]